MGSPRFTLYGTNVYACYIHYAYIASMSPLIKNELRVPRA